MTRTTPRVEQGMLILPAAQQTPLAVGSPQWFAWLADEGNGSFFFANEDGSFTARKERRKRGGWYWIAYRSQGGKLAKAYIGRSEALTSERLSEITALFREQRASKQNQEDAMSSPLFALSTRFAPPPLPEHTSGLLERAELLKRLDDGLHLKLTLVTAPAGYGKTTLLTQWYETRRRRPGGEPSLAWIALDERDNDPIRFWSRIWSALRQGQEGVIGDLSAPLRSTPQMSIEMTLAALLSTNTGGILVLDDYHALTNAQIHEQMEWLLANLPASMHLVIASRSEPPLSLARARVYREVSELHAHDLRLRGEEIERFLRASTGMTFSSAEQALLEQRTEGWMAALHLIALMLRERQRPEEVLAHFTGSQRALFAYFAEEVFARQPEAVQAFLLATAPLAEMTAPLCAAVLDDEASEQSVARARQLLVHLERANLFLIPLDEQQQRYRYHALFSEFLQEKLRQSAPERLGSLHQRAARFYERQQMREEALEHALAGHDQASASRLIVQLGEEALWRRGEVKRLLTWLEQLPFACRMEDPQLSILYAWALLLSGEREPVGIAALLEIIESRNEDSCMLKGDLSALRAGLASFQQDIPQAIFFSHRALQELPEERMLLRASVALGVGNAHMARKELDEAYRVLGEALHISQALSSLRTAMFASRYLAIVCIEQGRMAEAEAILRQALRFAGDSVRACVPATGIVHIGLAELLYERNELAGALHHATLGKTLGESCGEFKVVLGAFCILALIYATTGEVERAWQEVWQAERVATLGRVTWLIDQTSAIAIRLSLLQGDPGGAKRALRDKWIDSVSSREQVPAVEQEHLRLMLARVWLDEEKYGAVDDLLAPVIHAARQEKRVKMACAALSLHTIALYGLRERQRASQSLNEALRLAGPERYLRTLLDIGEPFLNLLRHHEGSRDTAAFVRELLEATGHAHVPPEQSGNLSTREYEVLQFVAAGMSNQQIAEALIIEASTVKVHVRHICQKLGVQNRLQAAARARENGLLSQKS